MGRAAVTLERVGHVEPGQVLRLRLRLRLRRQAGRVMSVNIDELHTTVEAEPAQQGAAAPSQGTPGPDESARQHRELLACVARDMRRTRAEGYDD